MPASPLLQAFDRQAQWCARTVPVAAPFTARVLRRSEAWLGEDAAAHDALSAVDPDPLAAALALRWAAGLHHLALRGLAPWAQLWPPAVPASAPPAAPPSAPPSSDDALDAALDAAIRAAWRDHQPAMRAALALPPQTNEVQRSAALLPGLLHVAAHTGLPLALLEIGASAGLNLWCDRYRHAPGGTRWHWGDADAPLALHADWRGAPPLEADAPLRVVHRAACDAHPIDLTQPGEQLRLASFIWPDQPERLARLRAATAAAAQWLAQDKLTVEALPAANFVSRELAALAPGRTTVLMHSVVWQYIAADEQADIRATVAAAAARATPAAPLAWLRFEPPGGDGTAELRCQLWPARDGNVGDRLLARAHPHGAWIAWLDGA